MYINWAPLRALVGAGSDGKIELNLQKYDRKPRVEAKEARSLDGTTETVLHRIDYEITVKTVPTADSALQAKFREFMASVAAGETFAFDALGTEASPVDAISVSIIPNSYTESRESVLYFSYTFRMRES